MLAFVLSNKFLLLKAYAHNSFSLVVWKGQKNNYRNVMKVYCSTIVSTNAMNLERTP